MIIIIRRIFNFIRRPSIISISITKKHGKLRLFQRRDRFLLLSFFNFVLSVVYGRNEGLYFSFAANG